ncbi:MAG: FGGY family carbohydrate kinase [Alphaproteobacteria bacterium]|nr:FGGY family carbohydrate kinase [Alphaproteobacteria bacterium]
MSTSRRDLLLGIDAGTSRVRALVFTPDGQVLSEGSRAPPTRTPKPRWAEQDAEAIWQACITAIRQAVDPIDRPERIRGIGISSVGEAFVPLDAAGAPTYPVIAWYDQRSAEDVTRLFESIDRDTLFDITGLAADPTFTLSKLLWLKANAPDALSRTRRVLNVTHYLAWRLTGVETADLSQASRSLALDLHGQTWARDLIREVGLDPSLFAELRPLGERLGNVQPGVAAPLPPDCVVGVGGHDHILGALAAGALAPGTMLNSLGTAEAVTLAMPRSSRDPELGRRGFSQGVVSVDRQTTAYVFGGFQTSGASIEWFRSLFGAEIGHDALMIEAERVPPGALGAMFVPDLRGRLLPIPDPLSRGAWLGLTADHDRAVLYRALLEGLAFEARQSIDGLDGIDDIPEIEAIRAIGGNTRNALLMRIKASVYQKPISATVMPEATALGAALLGGVAAGLWPTLQDAVQGLAVPYQRVEPIEEWIERYERLYQDAYRKAYAALRPLNHALGALTAP